MPERFDKDIESKPVSENNDYPVMPLRNTVLFPQQVIPIYIGREKSLKLIEDLGSGDKHIVVVAQEDGSIEDPKPEDLYAYGTLGVVLKVFDMPDNSKSAIVQGIERVKLLSFGEPNPYYKVVVEKVSDQPIKDDLEVEALSKNLRNTFTELIQVAPNLTEEHSGMLSNIFNISTEIHIEFNLLNILTLLFFSSAFITAEKPISTLLYLSLIHI